MIAVDTNVLVYAHRADSPHHRAARSAVERLVDRGERWAIPWPCVNEFLALATHARIYDPPSTSADAVQTIQGLLDSGTVGFLAEGPRHLGVLGGLLRSSGVTGPKVHDARIAAMCLDQGVTELWSADRDFSYFPPLRTTNPLV